MARLLLILLFVYTPWVFAEYIPGQRLLDHFSSYCKSQGDYTRAALYDAKALIENLRALQQDPDCQTVVGGVQSLDALQAQLMSVQNINQTQNQLAEIQSQEQTLLTHLSGATDPAVLDQVNEQLRALQLQRASVLSQSKAQKDLMSQDKTQLMVDVIHSAQSTFRQISQNQTCMGKHPRVLNAVTSMISSIGKAATVVNPAIGFGVSAVSEFLGATIEGSRQLIISKKIQKLSDQSTTLEGIKCALETMSERWCEMQDTEAFLNFRDNPELQLGASKDLETAIRLSDRDMVILIDWLMRVRSGVIPTTTAEADRQSNANNRVVFVQNSEKQAYGLIGQTRLQYESLRNNQVEQKKFLRNNIILKLIPPSSMGMPSNALNEIYSMEYAPYYLIGCPERDTECGWNTTNGAYEPFINWDGNRQYDLALVEKQLESWIKRALTLVEQERTLVLQPDAELILSEAYERAPSRFNKSPMDALTNLITFMKAHPPTNHDQAFNRIYNSTIEKLENIYEKVNDVILTKIFPNQIAYQENLVEAVNAIYREAQLEFGTIVLQSRLEMILRLSLLQMMEQFPPQDQNVVAQFLAAERFSENLRRATGKDSVSIHTDIRRARPMVEKNLQSFAEIYHAPINRILKRLSDEEATALSAKPARTHEAQGKRNTRAELCFLMLAAPKGNKKIKTQYCKGLTLAPLIVGGPSIAPINQSDYDLDVSQRMCRYREFHRQSRIYEKWKIR